MGKLKSEGFIYTLKRRRRNKQLQKVQKGMMGRRFAQLFNLKKSADEDTYFDALHEYK